jgi:hypothetical protein
LRVCDADNGARISAPNRSANAAAAKNGVAPETANRHPQENPPTGDRQIGGLPQISTLNPE